MARLLPVAVVALVASVARAESPEVEAMDKGNGALAVRLLANGVKPDARHPYLNSLFGAIERYVLGNGAADPTNARALAELAAKAGHAMVASSDAATADLGAEALLLLARQRVVAKDPAWLDAWREAARSLVPSGNDPPRTSWSMVRAVEMLCEGALQPGAPGQELLDEAKKLAPEGDEAPALAYRLGHARYLAATRRPNAEVGAALGDLDGIRAALDKDTQDLDRATIVNDAIAFAKQSKLPLKAAFLLDPKNAATLSLSIPRSRRWVVVNASEYGAKLWQLNPSGSVRSEIDIFNLPPDAPGDSELRGSNTTRANAYLNGACKAFGKIKRQKKPARGFLGVHISGVGYEVEGLSRNGYPRRSTGFVFTGKSLKDSFGVILRVAHGEDAGDDADAKAFLDAVRDG